MDPQVTGSTPVGHPNPLGAGIIQTMTDLAYGAFDALTFDCYGTLIDWEAGILAGLRRVLGPGGDAA